ncbi:MAG: hypothetical protein E6Q06_02500 [Candidatus Moraniibacteriota bacterium]|nr:MAG: hypothetical protein E6Q06_02500 [Candidatus Moranbacteria bacterium]
MIRKTISFGALSFLLVSLSGCALAPPKIGNGTLNQPEPSAFDGAAQPGSVWRSDDGGQSFAPKTFVDEKRKLTKADVLSISFLQREADREKAEELRRTPDVYVGTVDDMIFKTDDGAEVWQPVNFPPEKVYSFIASRRSVDRMYATGVVGGRGKIFRTTDGGEVWTDVYSEPGTGTTIVTLAEHPTDVNILFAGTSTGTLVKSSDGGGTWKNIGTKVNGPITSIAFDAKRSGIAYLLSFNSTMYISRDTGETWSDWASIVQAEAKENPSVKPEPSTQVQGMISLIADPYIEGLLYAGTKTGLYKSINGGRNWQKMNIIESAERFPIRAVAVNPRNSKEIVFVAGRTFYKSVNSGETWSVSMLGVDREVSVLAYDPVYPDVLYLGLRKIK